MLDSDLYPNPYIKIDNYRIDFFDAKLNDGTIRANVKISKIGDDYE